CLRCLTFFGINMAISQISDLTLEISETLSLSPFSVSSRTRRPCASFTRPGPRFVYRIRAGTAGHRRIRVQNLSAINPNLNADDAKRGVRFSETVVNIGAQCVQR